MAARIYLLAASLFLSASAAPVLQELEVRAGTPITNNDQLSSSLSAVSATPTASFAAAYTSVLKAIKPSPSPTDIGSAASGVASVWDAQPSNPLDAAAYVLLSGLAGSSNPFSSVSSTYASFGSCNGYTFSNKATSAKLYPKSSSDAPYDVSESALRSAIYFPPGFTYGKIKPAIFIPGTGGEGCEAFSNGLGKLFTGSSYADPVYVNPPGNMLNNIQINAEYIAYAINYISAVSGNSKVSLLSWSQGGAASQWALKYWPSTRSVVDDFIPISPDFYGTIEVPLLCPDGYPCAPAIIQQDSDSNFMAELTANGGDSSYVPTTEVHSIYDEIVEPQQGEYASAWINNNNGAGATNVEIESICSWKTPAGALKLGHEGALYNPVTYAVAVDAIKNAGPADINRSGAPNVCGTFLANGLGLSDFIATELLGVLGAFNTLAYAAKVTVEPALPAYSY